MKNRLLLVGAGALVLVIVVWLIRSEGERFRKSMKEAADESVHKGIVEGAERAVDKAGEKAERVIDKTVEGTGTIIDKATKGAGTIIDKAADVPGRIIKDVRNKPGDEASKPGGSPATPSPDVPPSGRVPDATAPDAKKPTDPPRGNNPEPRPAVHDPATAKSPPDAKPAPADNKPEAKTDTSKVPPLPAKSTDVIGGIFQAGHELSKTLDDAGQEVFALSSAEERKLGRDLHAMVRKEYKLLGPAAAHRLERLANPILPLRARKDIDYHFFVVNDKEVNAFSTAGGYIYVNKGLLDLAQSDAEVQFVLGHEIAHVDLRHCVKGMTYTARASEVAGEAGAALVQIAYKAIALGYSEDNEFEADAWSFRKLLTLGRSREEALAFPKKMVAHFKDEEKEKPEKPQTAPAKGVQEVQNHFRSHPHSQERVERLEAIKP